MRERVNHMSRKYTLLFTLFTLLSFYILLYQPIFAEDISNTSITTTINSENSYTFNFENGPGEWIENGEVRLIRSHEYVNSGRYSIYVDHRKNSSDGIALNADFLNKQVDTTYSAYVLYSGNDTTEIHNFNFNIQYMSAGKMITQCITSTDVSPAIWTELSGRFTLPADATHVKLVINTSSSKNLSGSADSLPFYIDNIKIIKTSALTTSTVHTDVSNNNSPTVIIIIIAVVLILLVILAVAFKTRKKNSDIPKFQVFDADELKQEIAILSENPDMCKDINILVCSINFTPETLKHKEEAINRCAMMVLRAAGKYGSVYRTQNNEFVCMSTKPIKEQLEKEIAYETSKPSEYPFSISTGFAKGDERNVDIRELVSAALSEVVNNENLSRSLTSKYLD